MLHLNFIYNPVVRPCSRTKSGRSCPKSRTFTRNPLREKSFEVRSSSCFGGGKLLCSRNRRQRKVFVHTKTAKNRKYGVTMAKVAEDSELSELEERISAKVDTYLKSTVDTSDSNLFGSDLELTSGAGLLTATGIGVVTGLAVCLFEETQGTVKNFFLTDWLSFLGATKGDMLAIFGDVTELPSFGASWPIATIPLFGGLAITLLRFALGDNKLEPALKTLNKDPAEGANIVPWKPAVKAGAAAVTLGTANSLGPEGPVVELGGNVGLWISSKLGYKGGDLRGFLAAGAAAGLASGFNAPISAIFFSLEVVLQQTKDRSMLTVTLLSAVVAAAVKDTLIGLEPKFIIEESTIHNGLLELPMFLAVGAACGLMAYLLEQGMARSREQFDDLPKEIPNQFHPLIGSTVLALTALVVPQVLFLGYRGIDQLLSDNYVSWDAVITLLEIASVKVVMTSVCMGSGLIGGVFAPSLFIGAATGAAVGTAAQLLGLGSYAGGIDWVSDPSLYALIGMPAMLAAYVNAPLTSILLLFEVTRDYSVMLPVMAGVSMSTFTNIQLNRYFSPAQQLMPPILKDVDPGVLKRASVLNAVVKDYVTVPESTKLIGSARAVADMQTSQGILSCKGIAITDDEGTVVGAMSIPYLVAAVGQMTSELETAFKEFDEDGSNTIDEQEVFALLTKVGTTVTEDEVSVIFDKLDRNRSGEITFNEFCNGSSRLGVTAGNRTLKDVYGETSGVLSKSASLLDAMELIDATPSRSVVVVDDSTGEVIGIILEDGLVDAANISALEESLESLEC